MSANSARAWPPELPRRSNSSTTTASLVSELTEPSARRTSCGVTGIAAEKRGSGHARRLHARAEPHPLRGPVDGDLRQRLAPDARVVVARVAVGAHGHDARAAEHLGDNGHERGLADTALAVDHRVLSGLRNHGEELGDLVRAACEEPAPVDRRGGAERLGHQPHAVEELGLCHGGPLHRGEPSGAVTHTARHMATTRTRQGTPASLGEPPSKEPQCRP